MLVDVKKVDNVVAKSLIFQFNGDFMQGHVHTFDHIHLVGSGVIEIIVDGSAVGTYTSGDMINIEAGKVHSLRCLSDSANSWCIHALKESDTDTLGFKAILV